MKITATASRYTLCNKNKLIIYHVSILYFARKGSSFCHHMQAGSAHTYLQAYMSLGLERPELDCGHAKSSIVMLDCGHAKPSIVMFK
jgi:hypothetical protein